MPKKLLIIFIAILFIFVFILSIYIFNRRSTVTDKGDNSVNISLDNSYLFASPLIAQADGIEKIRVTIFVLNDQGSGVPDRAVTIGQYPDLSVEVVQSVTDAFGKAVFDLSSTKSFVYDLEVQVDRQSLPQQLKLTYR
jgi:hypothetical protein